MPAATSSSSSSPIAFLPRQIMLHSTTTTNNKTTLEIGEGFEERKQRDLLLGSIAAFLESNGFRKTLKALQSEANLEIDCWKSASLNLENQFYKILELSTSQAKANIDSEKDEGSMDNIKDSIEKDARELITPSGNGDFDKLKINADAIEETKEKKRKKKSVAAQLVKNADDKHFDAGNGASETTYLENHSQKPQENKEKKKKKHRLRDSSDPHTGVEDGEPGKFREAINDRIEELKSLPNNLSESDEKVEKKKKKRVKGVELESSDHATQDLQKREKKKKSKLSSEGLSTSGSDQVDDNKSDDQRKKQDVNQEIMQCNPVNKNLPIAEANNDVTVKSSKKRKRSASESTAAAKVAAEESKGKSEDGVGKDDNPNKAGKSSSEIEHPVDTKRRRTENSEKCDPETLVGNKTENGSTDANGTVGGIFSKSMTKEKHSTERKSSVPFQRVKMDEVSFVDERLQDNSYWAKGGADSGYGAKAQEVLGQVKGRGFRHEKTKKKRGSYRGGQIDLHSHSVKFNYSDEE